MSLAPRPAREARRRRRHAGEGDEATRWAGYSGLYRTLAWDVLELEGPPARFLVEAGSPTSRAKTGTTCSLAIASPRSSPASSWRTTATLDLGPFRPGGTSGSFASRTAPLPGSGRSSGRPRSSRSPGSAARWPDRPALPASQTATSRWRGLAATVAGATALVVPAVALLAWLRAGRRRLPRLAAASGRASCPAPSAGGRRPGCLHGRSRRCGLDRTLVAARGQAAVHRARGHGGCARCATRWLAPHRGA